MDEWNTERALKKGSCKTRDGRIVLGLKEAVLDGRSVLIGDVITMPLPWPKGKGLKAESHYWMLGGLGHHGGDDLVEDPNPAWQMKK